MPRIFLFRNAGFPRIFMSRTSQMNLTLPIQIQDFTIYMYADFSPVQNQFPPPLLTIRQLDNTAQYDSLTLNNVGVVTASNLPRQLSQVATD